MKIKSVRANNHRRVFEVQAEKGLLHLPYSMTALRPTSADPVKHVYVDGELGHEAFTFELRSGREESIHIEQVLEYNQDPAYMRDLLLYRLTIEAEKCVEASSLSKREITRRLGTSPAQLYRLLDPTNYRKSIDRLLALLAVVGCEVDLVVKSGAR